ncbi:protease modulator HflC [Desulfococcus multivorans]|uniref:Protein HflC n=1 Tax=Desulfococcus multivorans DSM 2059 TaxID=1121405 RepID=S7TWF1_DESML|nr:protease modulator HflC [Desulfococcus multivorans]AOY58055.1 HflC: membranecomplex HflKC protein C [Desulfococcus multivorans]AQV00418.1 protease modulator HflC [Desulfococcus multivorans]EPR41376.1 HflC protein [Desulfococcus multivorans DSM 2059]SJZ71391.1 membrane protease subunit HflC [Desulfococcus multivorans DSM 2059]
MIYRNTIVALVLVAAMVLFASAYVVDETEQVVITRFGRIIGDAKTTPGLKLKLPFIDQANFFPKILLQWDGDPGQIPTKEKTYIWVDAFARWKIVDPIKFLQTVTDVFNANGRLNDIIDPAVRNAITSHKLIEAVRTSNRPLSFLDLGWQEEEEEESKERKQAKINYGRRKLLEGILKQAQPKVDQFGIELVDVQIKRIDYVDTVRNSVFNRMIAERKQIAEKIRSEGRGEAQKIRGQKERELKRITSEAYRTAEVIKGKADAEATKLYAEAFNLDPDFYSFVKTLEVYGNALGQNSSLVMSTDSDFLQYLKGYAEAVKP